MLNTRLPCNAVKTLIRYATILTVLLLLCFGLKYLLFS